MIDKILINEVFYPTYSSGTTINQSDFRTKRIQPLTLNHSWNTVSSFTFKEFTRHYEPTYKAEDFIGVYAYIDYDYNYEKILSTSERIFYGQIKEVTLEGEGSNEGVIYTCYGPRHIAKNVFIDNHQMFGLGNADDRLPTRIYNAPKGDSDFKRSQNYFLKEGIGLHDGMWTTKEIILDLFYHFKSDLFKYNAVQNQATNGQFAITDLNYSLAAFTQVYPTKIVLQEQTFADALIQVLAHSCPSFRVWADPRNMRWRFADLMPPRETVNHDAGNNIFKNKTYSYGKQKERPLSTVITPSTEDVYTSYEIFGRHEGQVEEGVVQIREGASKETTIAGSTFRLNYGDWRNEVYPPGHPKEDQLIYKDWTCYSSTEETYDGRADHIIRSGDEIIIWEDFTGERWINEWANAYVEIYMYDGLHPHAKKLKVTGTIYRSGYNEEGTLPGNKIYIKPWAWHPDYAGPQEFYKGDRYVMDKDPEDTGGWAKYYRSFQIMRDGQPYTELELAEECCNQILFGYWQSFYGGGGQLAWTPIKFAYLGEGEILTSVPLFEGDCTKPPVELPQNIQFRFCFYDKSNRLVLRYPTGDRYVGTASYGPNDANHPFGATNLRINNPVKNTKKVFYEEFGELPDTPAPTSRFETFAVQNLSSMMDVRFSGSITLDKFSYLGRSNNDFSQYIRPDTFALWLNVFLEDPDGDTTGFEESNFPWGLVLLESSWDYVSKTVTLNLASDAREFDGEEIFLKAVEQMMRNRDMREAKEEQRSLLRFKDCYGGEGYWPGGGGWGSGSGGSGGNLSGGGGGGGGSGGGTRGDASAGLRSRLHNLEVAIGGLVGQIIQLELEIKALWKKIKKMQKKLIELGKWPDPDPEKKDSGADGELAPGESIIWNEDNLQKGTGSHTEGAKIDEGSFE